MILTQATWSSSSTASKSCPRHSLLLLCPRRHASDLAYASYLTTSSGGRFRFRRLYRCVCCRRGRGFRRSNSNVLPVYVCAWVCLLLARQRVAMFCQLCRCDWRWWSVHGKDSMPSWVPSRLVSMDYVTYLMFQFFVESLMLCCFQLIWLRLDLGMIVEELTPVSWSSLTPASWHPPTPMSDTNQHPYSDTSALMDKKGLFNFPIQ